MVTLHIIPCHCQVAQVVSLQDVVLPAGFGRPLPCSSNSHGRKESQGSGAVSDAIAESTIQAQRGHPETLVPKHALLGSKEFE